MLGLGLLMVPVSGPADRIGDQSNEINWYISMTLATPHVLVDFLFKETQFG